MHAYQTSYAQEVGVGLTNSGNHCFLNSAVQAIFHLSSDAFDGDRPVTRELKRLLDQMRSGKTASPEALRRALDSAYRNSEAFREGDFGDSFLAFSGILQEVYKDRPDSLLVKRFQHLITEVQKCSCDSTENNWSEDSFGLPLFVMSGSFFDQLKEFLQGRPISMCLGSGRCNSTTFSNRFIEWPQVLVLQLSFASVGGTARHFSSSESLVQSIPESFMIEDLMRSSKSSHRGDRAKRFSETGSYNLKGAILMSYGHFFSGFKGESGNWTIYNDSSVRSHNTQTFREFQAQLRHSTPYMLFYSKAIDSSPLTERTKLTAIQFKEDSRQTLKRAKDRPRSRTIGVGTRDRRRQ
mmetsp:Transcript_17224/g.30979  ORF Transcript_17224/g.30979 Transcript_17224/m.30979 type:complete len:352 (-) Transcript_17224:7399-8454(-)